MPNCQITRINVSAGRVQRGADISGGNRNDHNVAGTGCDLVSIIKRLT
jgi:hypothetical protein